MLVEMRRLMTNLRILVSNPGKIYTTNVTSKYKTFFRSVDSKYDCSFKTGKKIKIIFTFSMLIIVYDS